MREINSQFGADVLAKLRRTIAKRLRAYIGGVRRKPTKKGYVLSPTRHAGEWEYRMTSREYARRKVARKIQAASRRANRKD